MKEIFYNRKNLQIFVVLAAIASCILVSLLFFIKIKVALAVPFIIFGFYLIWLYAPQTDEKKIIAVFLFLYPFLPCMAGFQIAEGIPVFRTQRIATIIIILYLIRKGLFLAYYQEFIRNKLFVYPLMLVILSMSISSFFSVNTVGSLFSVLSLVFESIIISVIVYNVFTTDEDIGTLINVICYSVLILSFLGIYERLFRHNLFFVFGVFDSSMSIVTEFQTRYEQIRIQGPFDHSIAFAGFLVCSLPIVFYKYRENIWKFNLSMGLIVLAIYFTQSRAGMICFIAVYVLYFLLINKSFFLPSLLVASVIILPNLPAIMEYYLGIDETIRSQYLSSERTRQFYFLLDYIKENIIWGYGSVDTPPLLLSDTFGIERSYSTSIDNYYLLYAYRWGAVGLAAYVIFLLSIIVQTIIIFRSRIFQHTLLLSILIGIIAVLLMNIVVALWSFLFLLWIYMGMICRIAVNNRTGISK